MIPAHFLLLISLAVTLLPTTLLASGTVSYGNSTYNQNFNTIAGTTNNSTGQVWANDSTLAGWHSNRTTFSVTDGTLGGSAAAFTVTNVANNVGLLSFGPPGSTDRALGTRATGGVAGADPVLLGVALTNTSAATYDQFTLAYTGEQWLQADTGNTHVLHLEYKLDATALTDATGWLPLSAGSFSSPRTGSTPTALDGNAAANRTARSVTVSGLTWAPGTTLWLRWRDANESGNEHGLAIDDVTFTASFAPPIVTGPWSGNLSPTSATISAAASRAGFSVRALASLAPDFSAPIASPAVVSSATNGNALRLELTGLAPDTEYYYALEVDGILITSTDKTGRFRTFPTPGPASFRIGFGSCGSWLQGFQYTYEALAAEDIRFFLQNGDLHYANTNANNPALYRDNYRNALSLGSQGILLRRHGSNYVWDDHDFSGDNSDRTGLGRLAHRQVYRELVPHYPLPDVPTGTDTYGAIYHAFTLGRTRFIVSDLRSQRDPSNQTDNAGKSMMGSAQKAWFKNQLLAARDTEIPLIVWVSSVAFLSSDGAGSDNWSAYNTERMELLTFIRDQKIQNLIILSGDMHGMAIDDGRGLASYLPGGLRIPVFHAASFTAVGSLKGGPYSHGNSAGAGRYGLLEVNDSAAGPVSVTFQGKIATSATATTVWNSLTHVGEPVRPLVVADLTATPDATGIALAWTDRSSVETGYRIERAASAAGPWTALATTAASATNYHDTTAAPDTAYVYRVISVNGTIESQPSGNVGATSLSRFSRWKLSELGDVEASATDDRDHDSRPALLEYALGGDPATPDLAPGFASTTALVGADHYLTLAFTRYPERDDITYRVQASGDLATWSEVAHSAAGAPLTGPGLIADNGVGSAPRIVQVRDTVAIDSLTSPRRFLRVQVTQP